MNELPVLQPTTCCSPIVREPLGAADAKSLAAMFKALGDPVRLRLLSLIASHEGGEACVCDLTEAFDLSQPTISHHLKVLHEAGLASVDERDTTCCYARQDKFWVQGAPDGETWEIYSVLADSPTFYADGHDEQCCGGTGQPGETAVSHDAACC